MRRTEVGRARVAPATFLVALLAALVGCGFPSPRAATRNPSVPDLRPPLRGVVVLVPGATGSMLRDRSGRVLWGRGIDLVRPRDGGYGLVHPVTQRDAGAGLEAFAVLERIGLFGVVRKPVYAPVVRALEREGYRLGVLTAPGAGDSLYLFPWDWRLSHTTAAARLAAALEAVRRARDEDVLPVALVCQSSGAHVCRWLARYGAASLEDVERGPVAPVPRLRVTTLVLVGSSNGGSLRILRELDRGRTYIPLIGRRWRPETLFTFPSLYEDLPAYRDDLFLDAQGEALDVDLYAAESWTRYGWSAFRADARKRLDRLDDAGPFGTRAQRLEYLRWVLDRTRRVQLALAAGMPPGVDPAGPPAGLPRYHLIQSRDDPTTPERAVLTHDDHGWRLLFAGDDEVDRDPGLSALAAAVGDGHATLESQRFLTPEETAALAGPPVYVPGAHFELIQSPEALSALTAALAE